ncbi:IucA/IucC family siderophore biosynthesis protein [Kineosporia sp. J2-2]|uniref:IucA/IucC family siderophore biosynthesis protein n=1 Tax=Kineosporia corallincola TaxID=2835133 RepID=A0ABS5TJP9_9ACTN|nr:IucA/IucC family siderophore biosynthesis protein [Kineosporia corallincola]MBT0771333.1 IucA/IucC family siderophore biosynthesis protein [Kineosporia corallincola]
MRPQRRSAPPQVPDWERDLVLRLGTALLREDVAGLRSRAELLPVARARVAGQPSGPRSAIGWTRREESRQTQPDLWLALNGLRMPVRVGSPARGDLMSDLVMREPRVIRVSPTGRSEASRLGAVIRAVQTELLAGVAPDLAREFRAGFQALLTEARAAALGAGLRHRRRSVVLGELRTAWPEAGTTVAGSVVGGAADEVTAESWRVAEALAAHRDHPVYPFSIARVGLDRNSLRRWAPEHAPRFGLRWVSVPREQVATSGDLPAWWPETAPFDPLPAVPLAAEPPPGRLALPVHPAMSPELLGQVLSGISWQPLPAPRLQVRPTLSMRTVMPEADPSVHLKVPLPMRTLGRLNLRLVSRASLADGAVLTHSLRALLERDDRFRHTVLTADESTWLHADPHLAVLVRRWPRLPGARVVPVAGLTARGWDGRMLIDVLSREFFGGDLDALLDTYLRTLLTWQLALWLRYGIVHEAHPQNVLVVLDRPSGRPRLRLLLRDLDSCLVDPELAGPALGEAAPGGLTDHRLISKDPVDLAAMFVTTTLHQCVASVLIETATGTDRPVASLLARVRPLLRELAEEHRTARDTALLTSGIIRAERLPVKRTLTAATLLPKSRTGAADVNKFYGADAPSYL